MSMPSGILKKPDRQYSYENTVLGCYRLEPSDGEPTPAAEGRQRVGFELADQQEESSTARIDQSLRRKKSVRFRDPEGAAAGGIHRRKAAEEGRPSFWGEEEVKQMDPFGTETELKRRRKRGPKQWLLRMRKWVREVRSAFSWESFRLMLIDWLFLAILGIGMALTSMFMDNIIEYLQTFQLVLMSVSGETGSPFLDCLCTYLSWLGYTQLLVISSAIFVHYIAPQAVGSGIPEMKTILRGVILKDYLTARTLFSKVVGLTFSLGSGIPIGKMGPFVHIASNAANLLSNLAARFDGAYGNECRKSEMLAAACATGVACTFSAPIGGVLFSIEVTTMYFSVRNYWRGFFAAACGATVFRWLRVVAFGTEVTLVAFYQTHFPEDSFEAEEMLFFALIGLLCGLAGAGFIFFYRNVVMFLRQNKFAKRTIQKNWLLYPIFVAFLVGTLTYPRGYGRFLSGRYKFTRTVLDFFSNCTWSKGLHHPVTAPHGCSSELLGTWTNHEGYGPYNVFLVLTLFTLTFFFLAALCNTMPIPCGLFMPLFVVGAALGRLMGELVSSVFPDGLPGGTDQPIFPGIYAVVGAAALTGAVTHSVSFRLSDMNTPKFLNIPVFCHFSVAMICCEITGQLGAIIPLMIAVIIANAVCASLQPSVYDVMIGIKNLPYLPDIPPSNAQVHQCTAEHIMESKVRSLGRLTQFKEIRILLIDMPKLRSFPVVDDPASMMLLGSISRRTLLQLLSTQLDDGSRKKEAERRIRLAIETIDRHFREAQMDMSPRKSRRRGGREVESDHEESDRRKNSDQLRRRASSQGPKELPEGARGARGTEKQKEKKEKNRDEGMEIEREGRRKKHPSGRVFPAAANCTRKASSRFMVEPVIVAPKRRCVSNVYPLAPSMPGATRNRRNAVSSAGVAERGGAGRDSFEECSAEDEAISNKKASCPELKTMPYWNSLEHQSSISRNLSEYVRSAKKRLRMMQPRYKETEAKVEYDLTDEERHEWELTQLEQPLEIEEKLIDPAPFQLVRRTSVYKVHYLFSLLDLERAYVTDRGRLVGVVALRDLRTAIQNAQNGISMVRNDFDGSDNLSAKNDENKVDKPPPESDVEKGDGIKLSNGIAKCAIMTASLNYKEKNRQVDKDKESVDQQAVTTHQNQHPPLHRIQEDENEHCLPSRSPSIRSRRPSVDDGITPAGHPKHNIGPTDVVEAVAYLRRKSIALEDLKPLGNTPLPSPAELENTT